MVSKKSYRSLLFTSFPRTRDRETNNESLEWPDSNAPPRDKRKVKRSIDYPSFRSLARRIKMRVTCSHIAVKSFPFFHIASSPRFCMLTMLQRLLSNPPLAIRHRFEFDVSPSLFDCLDATCIQPSAQILALADVKEF